MSRAKFTILNQPLVLAALVATAWVLVLAFGLPHELTFANIQAHRADLLHYSARHWVSSLVQYAALYIVLTAISFPGAALLSLVAGALYGVWFGTLVVSLAATLGSLAAFLTVRHGLGGPVRSRLARRFRGIDQGIEKDGLRHLFFLRLNPVVPFFLVNLGMGFTAIDTWSFVWVSYLGMLPASLLYVNAGTQLGKIHQARDLMSLPVAASLLAVGLIPLGIQRILVHFDNSKLGS